MAPVMSDVIRISAQQKYGAVDDVVNVFHFIIMGTPTPNTNIDLLDDVAEKLSLAWSNLSSHIPNGLQPTIVEGFNITQDAPLGQIAWPGPYSGGTGVSDAMPQDDCLLVLWGTDVKRRQGRTYLGPFLENVQSDSLWSSTLTSAVVTWSADLLDETPMSNGSELRLIVYSRASGGMSQPTSVRPLPLVAQQQRRKRGRGS